jgi:PPK2 family polyphosphate:nucleotide phosphotransferase
VPVIIATSLRGGEVFANRRRRAHDDHESQQNDESQQVRPPVRQNQSPRLRQQQPLLFEISPGVSFRPSQSSGRLIGSGFQLFDFRLERLEFILELFDFGGVVGLLSRARQLELQFPLPLSQHFEMLLVSFVHRRLAPRCGGPGEARLVAKSGEPSHNRIPPPADSTDSLLFPSTTQNGNHTMPEPITLKPGSKCVLSKIDLDAIDPKYDKKSANKRIEQNAERMSELANVLFAENKRAILLVLQGMDTAGKDGTIRTVMRGVNPRGCQVVSFKAPSAEELDHDFLWRVHQVLPRKGNIGIFNRSHYEDVLVVRVHSLAPKDVWQARFEQINAFEKLLVDTGTVVIKCFLLISKETQRERLQARIDDPKEHWKFNLNDLAERKLWDQYIAAYEEAITRCNTQHAPWYIIPSEKKWYRNLLVSELLRRKLEELNPQYPAAEKAYQGLVVE